MMTHKEYKHTKVRQLVWLFIACLCVIFSSAIKKVIQLHADQKISMVVHHELDGSRLTQNIKDGSREKHEFQALVVLTHVQSPNLDHPPFFALAGDNPQKYSAFLRQLSYAANCHPGSVPSGGDISLYLLLRNLRV
jgi:hypothetical protein